MLKTLTNAAANLIKKPADHPQFPAARNAIVKFTGMERHAATQAAAQLAYSDVGHIAELARQIETETRDAVLAIAGPELAAWPLRGRVADILIAAGVSREAAIAVAEILPAAKISKIVDAHDRLHDAAEIKKLASEAAAKVPPKPPERQWNVETLNQAERRRKIDAVARELKNARHRLTAFQGPAYLGDEFTRQRHIEDCQRYIKECEHHLAKLRETKDEAQ